MSGTAVTTQVETPQASLDNGPATPGTSAPILADSQAAAAVNEQTASFVIRSIAVTVCLVVGAIVGVLCYRVAMDGNAPVTVQITQQLANMVPPLVGSLVIALVGNKGISAIISKWTGSQQ